MFQTPFFHELGIIVLNSYYKNMWYYYIQVVNTVYTQTKGFWIDDFFSFHFVKVELDKPKFSQTGRPISKDLALLSRIQDSDRGDRFLWYTALHYLEQKCSALVKPVWASTRRIVKWQLQSLTSLEFPQRLNLDKTYELAYDWWLHVVFA